MTTTISTVSRDQVSKLISQAEGGRLSVKELEVFQRWLLVSQRLFTGLVDGKLLCIWGLIPPTLISDRAYLWLHVTPQAKGHEFILVRRSQIELRKMLEEYPVITGHCAAGATDSMRWLKWLGAQFGDPAGRVVPFIIRGNNG